MRSWVCEGCMQSLLQWYMQRENTSHHFSLPLWLGKWCGIYWKWSMHEKSPHIWKQSLWLPWLFDSYPLLRFNFMKFARELISSSCITRELIICPLALQEDHISSRSIGSRAWMVGAAITVIGLKLRCLTLHELKNVHSHLQHHTYLLTYSVKLKLGFQCSCKSEISSSGGFGSRCKW